MLSTLGNINIREWLNDSYSTVADLGDSVVLIQFGTFTFKKALQEHQITYPVPLDIDFKTWKAYDNGYWPELYLADRQGKIRYNHIGEGAYDETEQTIRQLLQEV